MELVVFILNKNNDINEDLPLFFTIINDTMSSDPKSNRHLVNALSDTNITMKNIQRYRNGESVPEFSIAKSILQYLGIKIPDKQLEDIIRNSKAHSKKKRDKDKETKIKKYIEIPGSSFDLGEDINPQYVIEFINNRIDSIYGDDKSAFSSYIRDLITKDIKDDILRKEDRNG